MKIIIHNCNDKQLKQSIIAASDFFSLKLLPKEIIDQSVITIRLKQLDKHIYGECFVPEKYHNVQHPRNFVIDIDPNQSNVFRTLAHEFVHVKQYAKGELTMFHVWKKKDYSNVPYSRHPWEIEARTKQQKIFRQFIEFAKKRAMYIKWKP